MKEKVVLKKITAIISVLTMVVGIMACGAGDNSDVSKSINEKDVVQSADSEVSQDGPFGAYPEEIIITMGRQTILNPKLPDGDTYEDNAYTRWVKDMLNVKVVDEFEANGDDYNRQVSLVLSSGEMPDMMRVNTIDEVRELYKNDLIEDLSSVYEVYATDYLKSVYDSFEGRALGKVSFDGMMAALPGTNVDSGPSEVWIRADWLDKLGIILDEDGNHCITIDELEMVAQSFLDANPSNVENTVGIALAPWLTSGDPDGTFSMNAMSYALAAYPKTWMEKDGEAIYGSVTDEMKQALAKAADWYKRGLLDPQVGTRTWDDISALLVNGQTGITFGTWHIPDWLLNNVRAMDAEAEFYSYAIESVDGKVNCKHNDAATGYIVVRKGFEHPEIAIKMANLFYDKMKTDTTLKDKYPEVVEYQQNAVDGTARPFNVEINSYTSLLDDYADIKKGVNGEIPLEEVKTAESKNVVESVIKYQADPAVAEVTDWSRYHSRMRGIELIQQLTEKGIFEWITPIFPDTTPTMETNWANLEKLEEETCIKIVTGAVGVDEGFTQFVNDWKRQGGDQISQEIAESLE